MDLKKDMETLAATAALWPTPRPAVSIADIRGAVARAWCVEPNTRKEMDPELALAAADQVAILLDVRRDGPAPATVSDLSGAVVERSAAFRALRPHLAMIEQALQEYARTSRDVEDGVDARRALEAVRAAQKVTS